jgi:hypothetical protein
MLVDSNQIKEKLLPIQESLLELDRAYFARSVPTETSVQLHNAQKAIDAALKTIE